MRQFRQYGCTEFHGIVNYKKQLIKAYFSENEEHFNTIWYDEDKPLGTGGGLKPAEREALRHLLPHQLRPAHLHRL